MSGWLLSPILVTVGLAFAFFSYAGANYLLN